MWASRSDPHETLTTTVLFDREIVRVLNKHCVMCHVENGPASPLATYEQAWVKGRAIRADVISRHMPPWAAVQGYGQFANDNSLTLREVQFVVSWVEGLGPRNAGTVFTNVAAVDGPPPKPVRATADFDSWQLGKPDAIRQVREQGIDAAQQSGTVRAVIDLGLGSAQRIRGIEYKPADRRLVRAADFRVQETGQWLGSWTPWYGFLGLPADTAIQLPAGAHVVADIQYRGAGYQTLPGGSLGVFLAAASAVRTAREIVLEAQSSAGPVSGRRRGETTLTGDLEALAIQIGRVDDLESLEITARSPDGRADVLLYAKDFPTEWPTPYIMKTPVLLRRGTRLSAITYGNGQAPATIRLMVAEPPPRQAARP
jgi:hypothetical protein